VVWSGTNPKLFEAATGTMGRRMAWEYMVREFNVQDSDKILLVEEFLRGGKRWLGAGKRSNNANGEFHSSRLSEAFERHERTG
jgi:hypothetical protein